MDGGSNSGWWYYQFTTQFCSGEATSQYYVRYVCSQIMNNLIQVINSKSKYSYVTKCQEMLRDTA